MLVKKIIVSSILTSLSCSSVVFAAGMFPNAWKESDEGIWQAYVEGQFVHQSNNLARADSIIVPLAPNLPGSKATAGTVTNGTPLLDGDPDQDWGFGLGLGYVFASKKYDVRANYFALRSDRNQSATHTFGFATPITDPTAAPAFRGTTTSEKNYYDYTEADLTFGNFVHLSKRLTMRLGYGIEFADIKQHSRSSSLVANNSTIMPGGSDVNFDQNFKNQFTGVGPLFTVDGQYDITKYIAVVGAVGASALYGTSKAEYHSTSTAVGGAVGAPQETFDFEEEERKIALGLDTRLGLRFSKVVSRDAALNVEAGYEGVAYLNALQDGSFGNITGTNTNRFLASGVNNYSFEDDYNNYGPYVRVGVDFK